MSTTSVPHRDASLPPIAKWAASPHAAHTVQFYGADESLLDHLSRFVGTALGAGDASIVIATKAHRDGLEARLQARGLDVAKAVTQGRYFPLDAEDMLADFMLNGRPDPTLFNTFIGSVLSRALLSLDAGKPHISVFGEMVALLWARGNHEAALQLEYLWNKLAKSFPLSLMCAYPMRSFDREEYGEAFLRICSEHTHVLPVESYTALDGEEMRLRSITLLQQKAQALENEVTERNRVEEALRRTQAELESQVAKRTIALRLLSSRLLSLQDAERRRIARELHDSLGQCLVALKLNVEMLKRSPGREDLWSAAEGLMQKSIAEVRTLSYLLHPPTMDAAGFASAARWYVEGFGQRSGLQVTLDSPHDLGRLPDAIEIALFRVLQEMLTNVHRHSGASAAVVSIREDGERVVLHVKDNGCGISKTLLDHFQATGAGMGVGIAGIRERAWELGGSLNIESDSNGTTVQVTLPIAPSLVPAATPN